MESHYDWHDDEWFLDDWLDNCWRFLVQRMLLGNNEKILAPFKMTHSLPDSIVPSHVILAELKSGDYASSKSENKRKLRLYSFRSRNEDGYNLCPPFTHACLYDRFSNETVYCNFNDLVFNLDEYRL